MARTNKNADDGRSLLDALVELVGADAADPVSMTPDRRAEIGVALATATDGVKLARQTAAERQRVARASYLVLTVVASHEREAFKAENPDKAWKPKSFHGLGASAAGRAANIGDEFRELAHRDGTALFTTVKDTLLNMGQKALEEQLRVANGKQPRTPHANQAVRSRKAISTRISGPGGVTEHLAQCPDEVESVVREFLDAVGVVLPAAIHPAVSSWMDSKGVNLKPEHRAAGAAREPDDTTTETPQKKPSKVKKKGGSTLYLILHDYDLHDFNDMITGRNDTPQCVVRAATAKDAIQEFEAATGDRPVNAVKLLTWRDRENQHLKRIGREPWTFSVTKYERIPISERPYPMLAEYLAAKAQPPSTEGVESPTLAVDAKPPQDGDAVDVPSPREQTS